MYTYPALTDIHNRLSNKFFTLRTNARRDALYAKLMGKTTELALFPEQAPEKSPNRKFTGTQDIPVEQIVGTLSRQSDFDHEFRPLQSSLLDRWMNAYFALEKGAWEPIVVHKVGEKYYVEDGHHRVSVARLLGISFIQAKVWEYSVCAKEAKKSQPAWCTERSSANAYAAQCNCE